MYQVFRRLLLQLCILASIILLGAVGITHSVFAHPGTPVSPGGYKIPFDSNRLVKITDGPGEGNHGLDCCVISTEAIDFTYVPGFVYSEVWTSIRAANQGTVIHNVDPGDGYGTTVIIQHPTNNFFSYYEHLDSVTAGILNTSVSKGAVIGVMGNTGLGCPGTNCTHLHFEVRNFVQTAPLVVGSGDSREHSIIRTTKFFKRIGLFPWYPNAELNAGFMPYSPTHPMGICLSKKNLTIRWLPPSQFDHTEESDSNADRFQGYDWVLDQSNSTIPAGVLDANSTTAYGEIQYPNRSDGNYWFHMRAYSTEYGWAPPSSVSHIGPFKINGTCKANPSSEDWFADPED